MPICICDKFRIYEIGYVPETKYACICETQNFIAMKDQIRKDAKALLSRKSG